MTQQKTIGIAADDWKLPVFRRRLDEAGFSYTEHPRFMKDCTLFRVATDDVDGVGKVVKAANEECDNG